MTGTAIADITHIPVSQGLSATLARASEGARASGAAEVSLEHVLAALCDDTDAADVLVACHIDTTRLKSDVIRFLAQQSGGGQPLIGPVTVSPALLRILEAAAAAARGGRKRDINGAIVLAAVVGDGRSIAAQILQDHGLTFDEAIKALQAAQANPARAPGADLPPPAEDVLARARERVQSRAAPSLQDMMARPQLAERAAPAPGFPDIVPPHAGGLPWPPPAEVSAASLPPQPPIVAEPVGPEPAIATVPEHLQAEAVPAELTPVPPAAPPDVAASEPVVAKESIPEVSAASADVASPRVSVEVPPPTPPAAPFAAPAPHPGPFATVMPAPSGGMAKPRWTPTGHSPPEPQPPFAPAASASDTTTVGYPAPFPAPVASPAAFPPPSAYPPPAGMPPLPGLPPHAIPAPPFPVPAPSLPGVFAPNQAPSGLPPVTPSGALLPVSPYPPQMAPQRRAPPPGTAPFGFDTAGRHGPRPPPLPPAAPGASALPPKPYGVQPSAAATAPRREGVTKAELVQLAEHIPRTMRAGVTERVEIRLARDHAQDRTGGMDGVGTAWRHDVTVTKAMSVRLRAPEGGFFIESASPETQWIDNQFLDAGEDYASWRFLVTPHTKGWLELQILVSARTVGSDGLAAETAFPDQRIDVKVRTNYGRAAVRGLGWAAAALAGGAVAKFGAGAFEAGSTLVAKLLG